MESIKFFVLGKPKGKGRPRFGNGHSYTDAQTRDYENQIANSYRRVAHGYKFPEDAFIRVKIQQQMPVPKSTSKRRQADMLEGKIYPSAKPDLDNVIKVVLDGLNGVAYKDDSRVVWIHSCKVYSETSGVLVEVSRMDGD